MREPRELQLALDTSAVYIGCYTWMVTHRHTDTKYEIYSITGDKWDKPSEIYGAFLELYLNGEV